MHKLETAHVNHAPRMSAVWLLPIIAAMIAGWLLYKNIGERGLRITVAFESGSGITAGITPVIYQGITVGQVTGLQLNSDYSGVLAELEIDQHIAPLIRRHTRFWLVSPQLSLSRISGLDTLVNGNYISFQPGDGEAATEFTALSEAPLFAGSGEGLGLTLHAPQLGSISVGAPLLYQQIDVGDVEGYRLLEDGVEIQARIAPQYRQLLKAESRFWNVSGVKLKAGLDGVELETGSLQTIIAGGIAFDSPGNGTDPAENPSYTLHPDRQALEQTITTLLVLTGAEGLKVGSALRMQGLKIGEVTQLELDSNTSDTAAPGVTAMLQIPARFASLLNSRSEFWVVKPEIQGTRVRGLDTLISGPYLAVRSPAGDDGIAKSYRALDAPPPSRVNAPGLRLRLRSDELHSVDVGSKIYFRKIAVGQVETVSLDSQGVDLGIFIHQAYAKLVRRESRFYNASGLKVSGGLGGLDVQAESLASIISGGIAFYNPEVEASQLAWEGLSYPLFSDYKTSQAGSGVEILLHFEDAANLSKGTELKYQGIKVGEVTSVGLDKQMRGVQVRALLDPSARDLAREGSRFWLVRPQFGLIGSRNLETLVTGSYIGVEAGSGAAKTRFQGLDGTRLIHTPKTGLNLVLLAPRRGSLKEGVQVFYRDVPVGEVYGFRLSEDARQTEILVNIQPQYSHLVRSDSQFWNSSGIDIDFSLFKGANIRSKSIESLLGGGIAFATRRSDQAEALSGAKFTLHNKAKAHWLDWSPALPAP